MSLLKLRLFTVLATMVAFAAVGRLSRQIKEFSAKTPNTPSHADGSLRCSGQATKDLAGSYRAKAFRTESEMPPTFYVPVQSKNAKDLAAGTLLVASRDLGDPNFAETVVLLVHYDGQSVVGLILNRRTGMPLSQVLDGLKAAKDRSDPVYLGGPLERRLVFGLFQSPAQIEGAELIFGEVYLISPKILFEQTISPQPSPGVFHVYLGYAGWTIDQLRKEVERGAWFIFPADANTVFNPDPDSLWPQMIRKTELQLAASSSANEDSWTSAGRLIAGKR